MSRAVPLVILAVGAFGVGIAIGASSEESEAAQSFADAWERQDFEAMHAELSPAAQEEYSVEELTRHYVDTQATATAIEVGTGEISVEDDAASFPVTVETEAFGDVEGTVALPLDEEGAVDWEPYMAFPGLEADEELGRETRWASARRSLPRTALRWPRGRRRLARRRSAPRRLRSPARWDRPRESRTWRSTPSAFPRARWQEPAGSNWRSTSGSRDSRRASSSPSARRDRSERSRPESRLTART